MGGETRANDSKVNQEAPTNREEGMRGRIVWKQGVQPSVKEYKKQEVMRDQRRVTALASNGIPVRRP